MNPIELSVGATAIAEKPEAVGWWVNKEAQPLLRALRDAVNGLIVAPPELRETSGPTDIPLGAVADGEFLKREGLFIVGGSPRSVSHRGFRSRDQGGASVGATTRIHIAGYANTGGTFIGRTVNNLQSIGAGQMAYAIPEYFERGGIINRLVTRTNGTVGILGTPRVRMGVYADGTLSSGFLAGSPFPGSPMGQSASIDMLSGGVNKFLESADLTIEVVPGSYVWFTIVFNNQAVTNQHTVPAFGYLYPIQGFTFNPGGPTTIAQDAVTAGVGWRHAITFGTAEDFPDPFPQSAPAILTDPVLAGAAANIPVIGYGFQAT